MGSNARRFMANQGHNVESSHLPLLLVGFGDMETAEFVTYGWLFYGAISAIVLGYQMREEEVLERRPTSNQSFDISTKAWFWPLFLLIYALRKALN